MRKDKAQRLQHAAVEPLVVALKATVVGQIQLANAGGIAAAAEVLHQQRVVEVAQRGIAEAQFAANMNADPAAADAMARRLPLRHVQRMAQATE
jgi:hypothetical protein